MKTPSLSRRNFMLQIGALTSAVVSGLALPVHAAAAPAAKMTGANLSGNADELLFNIQLDTAPTYKVFTLANPERVVIDLSNTSMSGKLKQGAHDRPPLTGIRYAARDDGKLRIVLEMREAVTAKAKLKADGGSHTLTITITPTGKGSSKAADKADKPAEPPAEKKTQPESRKQRPTKEQPVTTEPDNKQFIVVIDPGHGGKDPGAIGPGGTYEKDVVLQVARKLKARIDRDKGMKAILTRDSDTFLPLRERMDIAHRHKADLFISVHADANPSANVSGSSVYILSAKGASSEAARLLAESENAYDVKFGGRSLSDTSSRIASVLLDLSQNAMIDRSLNLAKGVLGELAKVNNPLRNRVESAHFVVLRSPDIPSMLVETAFISNPAEEKRLRTAEYQQKLAAAMFKGVKQYQLAYANNGRVNA